MYRLCQGDKDARNPKLAVKEIFDDICVETKDAELM